MSEAFVQLGDAVVDLVAHEVRRAGGEVGLSANEVALLQHLLQQDGAPVSRQELHPGAPPTRTAALKMTGVGGGPRR